MENIPDDVQVPHSFGIQHGKSNLIDLIPQFPSIYAGGHNQGAQSYDTIYRLQKVLMFPLSTSNSAINIKP